MGVYRIYQVDAFTRHLFKGNAAGVVPDADRLTAPQMQTIARELNNSETAFILSPKGDDHDLRIRYFTPTTEVPICGHATIAAHYVRATEKSLPAGYARQKTRAGIQEIEYVTTPDDDYRIIMTQGEFKLEKIIEGQDRAFLLSSLGLADNDLYNKCPMQIASTGHSKVMISIESRAKLNSLAPNLANLIELSNRIGCNGYFVFTLDSDEAGILTHGRMFAPAIGIDEDPVTGNANGPLGAYLVHYRLAEHDGSRLEFYAKQGTAMKKEGIVQVIVDIEDSRPSRVRIGGDAVIAFKTEMIL